MTRDPSAMADTPPILFEVDQPVMFQHCDPAGIVFYPRYFEMINATVEMWCRDALDWSFAQMHERDGVAIPLASIQVDFKAPSRLGDVLTWRLAVRRMGRSSLDLRVDAAVGGVPRIVADATLVHVAVETKRPLRWPDWLRARLSAATMAETASRDRNGGAGS